MNTLTNNPDLLYNRAVELLGLPAHAPGNVRVYAVVNMLADGVSESVIRQRYGLK